jgi:hypothetical protein
MTGIGPVAVRCPCVRDRVVEGSERIRFSSASRAAFRRATRHARNYAAPTRTDGFSWPRDAAGYEGRTTSTGTALCVNTLTVSLPSTMAEIPRRPCEAMTMRSQPLCVAVSIMP